jgi:hypothetical protein
VSITSTWVMTVPLRSARGSCSACLSCWQGWVWTLQQRLQSGAWGQQQRGRQTQQLLRNRWAGVVQWRSLGRSCSSSVTQCHTVSALWHETVFVASLRAPTCCSCNVELTYGMVGW